MRRNKPTGSENQQTQAASPAQDQRRVCNALSAGPPNFFRQLRIASFRIIEVDQLNPETVFNLALPRSCKQGRQRSSCSRSSATCFESKMWPASPQSMMRWAMLIPAPVTFMRLFTSITSFRRPLWIPIRIGIGGVSFFSAWLSSNAHRTGDSGLSRKTSAIPSPVATRSSLFFLLARRTCSVPCTSSFNRRTTLVWVVNEQFRISHHVDEQDVPDSESGGQVRWHTETLADSDARRFPLQELVQFHNLSSRLIATDVGS